MNLAITRLNKEAREYQKLKDEIRLLLRDDQNIYKWQAYLKGPPDTPYSEGTFLINIDVPNDYPISPPKCKFITKVFHPNIHFETGEICFELLKDKWSPAWTLESVCRAILDLLSSPNADSPLNCDCGIFINKP
jgi:peroxin-4